MHSYPLHRNIDVECECCRLIQPFNLTSKHDQVICKACVRHVLSSAADRVSGTCRGTNVQVSGSRGGDASRNA